MSSVTVNELEEIIKQYSILRAEIEEEKKLMGEKTKALDELEGKIMATLKEIGKTSYKSEHGTISRVEKWRVNLPATPEEKAAFSEYLKSKELFEKMYTFNSNTLNSFYMEEWEQAKNSGDPMDALNFRVPGINEPKMHEIISFRKK